MTTQMTMTATLEPVITDEGLVLGYDAKHSGPLAVSPAMAKSINDIIACAVGTPREDLDRLRRLLARMAVGEQVARFGRAAKAEALYNIQKDGIWKELNNPDTDRMYRWYEFRKVLSAAFGISESSLGNYLCDARVAEHVLDIPDGGMKDIGGLKPIRAFQEIIVGTDARSGEDISTTVRPVSVAAEKELIRRYGQPPESEDGVDWKPHLKRAFSDSFAFNESDPTAINKTPWELSESGRAINGRPKVSWAWGDRMARSIKWYLQYPDTRDEDGVLETGEMETGIILLGNDLLPVVRADIERRLRMQESGDE